MHWNRSGKFEYVTDFVGGSVTHKLYVDGKEVNLPKQVLGKPLTQKSVLAANSVYWGPENLAEVEEAAMTWSPTPSTTKVKKIWDNNKAPAKAFVTKFGVKASTVAKYLNGAVYSSTIKPFLSYSNLWRVGRQIVPYYYDLVVSNWDLIEQCEKDGMKHVSAFVAYTGKTPQELKKQFGKGAWKTICANSYTRNILLAQKYLRFGELCFLDVPSTLLNTEAPDVMFWVAKSTKKTFKSVLKHRDAKLLFHKVLDCRRMKETVGQPFSLDWSARRMEEEHDAVTRYMRVHYEQIREKSDAAYKLKMEAIRAKSLKDKYQNTKWSYDGVYANLLLTYEEIQDEGSKMRHCVGSYAVESMEEKYLVVHLESKDYKSTLGLNKASAAGWYWRIQQHYGVCNDSNVPQNHKDLANIVLKELNDQIKD